MGSNSNLHKNQVLQNSTNIAGLTQLSFYVGNFTGASFQIIVSDIATCLASISVLDECISIACDSLTSTAHGIKTGLEGAITVVKGAAKLTPSACISTACCLITEACHAFTTGEKGRFTTSCTLPSFCCCVISACTDYYAISLSANTYNVATSRALALAGTGVCITGAGVGNQTFTPNGTVPTGVCTGCQYFAIRIDDCTIKLASTHANALLGTAINLTALGSPAATLFNPTTPGAPCSANGTITFHPANDAASFSNENLTIAGPCVCANAIDLGTTSINSTYVISCTYYDWIQVDMAPLQGQYCIKVVASGN